MKIWIEKVLYEQEQYEERFLYPGSERLAMMEELPLNIALNVSYFFAKHNEYLQQFPIFQPSKAHNSGRNTKRHFEKYGWINFLVSISKTKVFDMAGARMNSIDCVRKAPAFDVLIFASEEKELSDAQYLDYEQEKRTK